MLILTQISFKSSLSYTVPPVRDTVNYLFVCWTISLLSGPVFSLDAAGEKPEQTGGEWGVNPFKQFQKNQADAIAVR
jgi:hypothetical protein